MSIYSVENLVKSYRGKSPQIIKGISFEIHEGEILGILGVNGVGKTTLIKLLLHMLEISGGKIEFMGQDLSRISAAKYYRSVSAVLERDRNVYWYLTGMQNIRYFGRLKNLNDGEISLKAENLLKDFDLYNAKDQIAGNYSRGMLQKLAIIIALLGDPRVLFLDEPTLGLDVTTKKVMMQNIKQMSRRENKTIVITSHQLDVVDEIADRILLLEDGKIAFIGKASEFKRMYCENRYTVILRGRLEKREDLPDVSKIVEKEDTTEIIFQAVSNRDIGQMISRLLRNDYEILAFTRDDHRLEDVMETFVRRGSEKSD